MAPKASEKSEVRGSGVFRKGLGPPRPHVAARAAQAFSRFIEDDLAVACLPWMDDPVAIGMSHSHSAPTELAVAEWVRSLRGEGLIRVPPELRKVFRAKLATVILLGTPAWEAGWVVVPARERAQSRSELLAFGDEVSLALEVFERRRALRMLRRADATSKQSQRPLSGLLALTHGLKRAL